jgi:hypothetical protein
MPASVCHTLVVVIHMHTWTEIHSNHSRQLANAKIRGSSAIAQNCCSVLCDSLRRCCNCYAVRQ